MPEPDTTPAACRWPDCLSPDQQAQLVDQVTASMHGEPTTPMPDQRRVCGCTEVVAAPADDVHVCKPGTSIYFCPTAGETESDCHGGFDVCCVRPDLHQTVPLCDRCGHVVDEHSVYGCLDECGCPARPDLDKLRTARTPPAPGGHDGEGQ